MKNNISILIFLAVIFFLTFLIQRHISSSSQEERDLVELSEVDSVFVDIPFETIQQGHTSGVFQEKKFYVITNQREWSSLWKPPFWFNFSFVQEMENEIVRKWFSLGKLFWMDSLRYKIPFIDFDNEMVIGAFFGRFGSPPYSAEIIKLEENESTIRATVETIFHGKNCITLTVLSEPFYFIKTKKSNKKVIFEEVSKTRSCE